MEQSAYKKFVKTTTIDSLFYFVTFLYLSFFSPYLSTLGWTEGLKGLFFAVFALTGIFFAPLMGTLSDKWGRFKVIILGIVLEIFALTGYIFVTNTTILFLLRIISAMAFNAVLVSGIARINDVVKHNRERSVANGVFNSAISVAALIAPLIGGFIADYYGYANLFTVSAICMVLILLIFLIIDVFTYNDSKQLHRNHSGLTKGDLNPFTNVKNILKFKELRNISMIGMASNFALPITALILPFLIMGKMQLSNSHLSIAIFIMAFTHIFQYFFGIYSSKIGEGKSILIGSSVVVVSLVLMFFAPSYEWLLVLLFLKSSGRALWNVSTYSYMSYFGEKYDMEGKVVGSYLSLSRMSTTLSFVISGFLLLYLQQGIFLIYAGIIFLATISFWKFFWKKPLPEMA